MTLKPLNIIDYPSPNFNERNNLKKISLIIIHYTEMIPAEKALCHLTTAESKVSCHYFIHENGTIYQLVDDSKRAWHAGISFWRGEKDINDISIGIELDHPGHHYGYRKFENSQITSLLNLLEFLSMKHSISKKNIWGHSDIAPCRKRDPGEFFDWHFLAKNGFGLWPKEENFGTFEKIDQNVAKFWLQEVGYQIEDYYQFKAAILAFQRHFLPKNLTGELDLETYRYLSHIYSLFLQENLK